jgi:hypothetical protein
MGISAQLVFQGHDHLRYLITSDGEGGGTVTISNAQLQTDALAGELREIARAKDDGIGTIPAGTPLTQDQARDILCADNSGASVGNKNAPRAKMITTPRSGSDDVWVDANVDVNGKPTVEATINASSSVAYLDIIDLGAIGTT